MAEIISIPTFSDSRGSLSVIESILPFDIKRVYYIYDVGNSERGNHAHKITSQALIMIHGSCDVFVGNKKDYEKYNISSPSKCLLLKPEDFHWMSNFSKGSVLLVLASHNYDSEDYI
ncbi:FdtA/QdtA family cupin domain-containing protein [Flavobacteriaceae bacterium]|nr:FdtA/QdtA family cupin domain-containing protein [Flavobacteriaceae bacterium]